MSFNRGLPACWGRRVFISSRILCFRIIISFAQVELGTEITRVFCLYDWARRAWVAASFWSGNSSGSSASNALQILIALNSRASPWRAAVFWRES